MAAGKTEVLGFDIGFAKNDEVDELGKVVEEKGFVFVPVITPE